MNFRIDVYTKDLTLVKTVRTVKIKELHDVLRLYPTYTKKVQYINGYTHYTIYEGK